ncbi:hypothetical protein BGZ95_009058 [Linnemannia exigua]|uniref:YTH domain-containing protein n=1 Tax=Linnemannia exigua TaxID=604196 RepID=A0AAD4DFK3_9FUNG|nr:hypothetical protein BGZ95_009058 [Linnemannia exigua]
METNPRPAKTRLEHYPPPPPRGLFLAMTMTTRGHRALPFLKQLLRHQARKEPQQQQHHSPYAQPLHRSTPPSPYYPARPHHGPSKPFSGQQGQGPGHMGAIALPHQGPPGYAMPPPPPPFFASNPSSVPPSPGSRRPLVYPGQPAMSPGSHPMPLADSRPGPPFHAAGGYKHPYMHPGYPQDYQQPGYYQTPEGWRSVPAPALQKKPKELDKAMWVGNVLNDTTVAELKAIFEAEPTEAEGDIPHDIPEASSSRGSRNLSFNVSIFILSKSNCAFVNYTTHEAVDRAVQRFHDREFKSTRLVCRPRKDPVPDPYSNKSHLSGRFQQQQQQHQHPSHLVEPMGYYNNSNNNNNESPAISQRMESGGAHPELSEVQSRLERMRLEGSPLLDSSSSGGEGSSPAGSGHGKRKPKTSQKKFRSSSSLGYAESRYFIMKGLNEEDLKLSAQFGLWATQEHLVPILNDAFMNSKNVYLVFSANKSGEFFGYARMMDLISTENEAAIMASREDRIWQPALEIPISPEMKAAVLEEIEQAAKEGRQLTYDEAEAISRESTTTKTWGIMFPVKWIDVHKVPFTRTTHMLNPLYENREVKVSKDGTEVDPTVGEQLVSLFKKTATSRKGRGSVSGTTSRTNSEASDSRRSSVAVVLVEEIDALLLIHRVHKDLVQGQHIRPILHHIVANSERKDISRLTPTPADTDSNNAPQGLYSDHPSTSQEHPRSGWNAKTNYRGGHGYSTSPYGGGPHMQQGGYYPQDQSTSYRKGGPGGGGGGGGKYNPSYHSGSHSSSTTGSGGSYEGTSFNSPHNNRRQGGSQPSTSPGHYRANVSPPGTDTFKHGAGGSSPALGSAGQPGLHEHGGYLAGARGVPMTGGQGPSHPAGGMMPPHPGVYAGQGPHGAHYASFPPPGYPMMPPYMGYSYVPGPSPFMHGAMVWHPGQGPPMPGGMMPGPSMVSGHAASLPMIPGAHGEVHGMEGMVPLIGYDGLTYGYIPAEEAYHQQMYGYGYMAHGGAGVGHHGETQGEVDENEAETRDRAQGNNDADEGETPTGSHGDDDERRQASRSRSLTDSTRTLTLGDGEDDGEDEVEGETSRVRTRTSRSISSSTTVSSSSTLIPTSGGSRKKSSTAATAMATSKDDKEGEGLGADGAEDVIEIAGPVRV